MDKITIPKEKILGLRYGELIISVIQSIRERKLESDKPDKICGELYFIENSDLQKAIDEFLKEYETKK